jgi:hypothetical protein
MIKRESNMMILEKVIPHPQVLIGINRLKARSQVLALHLVSMLRKSRRTLKSFSKIRVNSSNSRVKR